MKKTISLILFATSLVVLAGCPKPEPIPDIIVGVDPPPGPYDNPQVSSKSFVGAYINLDSIYIDGPLEYWPEIYIWPIYNYTGKKYSLFSSGEDKLIYQSLAAKHGDTTYTGTTGYLPSRDLKDTVFDATATTVDVVSIDVRSDADWDDSHPQGTSLNEFIRLARNSLREFIDSNYNEDFHPFYGRTGYTLSRTGPHEYDLMFSRSYGDPDLRFRSRPLINSIHNLTVTIRLDDGRTYSRVIHIDFDNYPDNSFCK